MANDRTKEFLNHNKTWRIEAVLHDGSWYTIAKWAKFAHVKKKDIIEFIENNTVSENIIHKDNSYRVSYQEIMRWYNNQDNISIYDRLVPNNFPPKIWDNQTEVEALLSVPRRKVTEVTITPKTQYLYDKCKNILRGTAIIRLYRDDIYRACGLSRRFIVGQLRKGLSNAEFKIVNPGRKTIMNYRELSDFSDEFLNNALEFYVPFAKTLLRPRMSTLKIYLPTQNDIDMQVALWIMMALRKFDEKQPVPFSGYLSRVLAFWPYDLPDEILGKELSTFQRNKKKIMNKYIRSTGKDTVPEEFLLEKLNISKEKYTRLTKEYQSWLNEHNASELTWENSSNEKRSELLWSDKEAAHNTELSHKMAEGIVKAALNTEHYNEAFTVINSIGSINHNDYNALQDLDDDFKKYLWNAIQSD